MNGLILITKRIFTLYVDDTVWFCFQYIQHYTCTYICRVHPETRVCNLRDELESQLGAELLPRDFIFLKSVGRSITRVSWPTQWLGVYFHHI